MDQQLRGHRHDEVLRPLPRIHLLLLSAGHLPLRVLLRLPTVDRLGRIMEVLLLRHFRTAGAFLHHLHPLDVL